MWYTIDIHEVLSKNWGSLINGLSRSIENTTKHILSDWHTQNVTCKLATSVLGINTRGTLEHLHRWVNITQKEKKGRCVKKISRWEAESCGDQWCAPGCAWMCFKMQ